MSTDKPTDYDEEDCEELLEKVTEALESLVGRREDDGHSGGINQGRAARLVLALLQGRDIAHETFERFTAELDCHPCTRFVMMELALLFNDVLSCVSEHHPYLRECLRTRDGRACTSRRTEEVGSWLGR